MPEAPPLPGGAFDILDRKVLAARPVDDGRVEESVDIVVAAYRPGEYEIPSVRLPYQTADGDTGYAVSQSIPIRVHSVLPEDQSDIQDIMPPVAVPGRVPVWVWVATAGLVAGAGLLGWCLWRRGRRPKVIPPPPPVDWPREVGKLLALGLIEKGAFREYFFQLSEIARRYLEDRTGVEAMERTTFEVVRDLGLTELDTEHVGELEGFLSGTDLVKFAKHRPSARAAADAAEQVCSLMRRIDIRSVGAGPQQASVDHGSPAQAVR